MMNVWGALRGAGLLLASAGVALALAGPAAAQGAPGQTPENAQLFLSRVVGAGGVRLGYRSGSFTWNVTDFFPSAGTFQFPDAEVLSAAPEGRCETKLGVYAKYGTKRYPNSAGGTSWGMNPIFGTGFAASNQPIQEGSQTYEYGTVNGVARLHWNHVAKVDVYGPTVEMRLHGGRGVRLSFTTEELAKRVGFAAEVLRLGCDPTADPNF